jgi:ABC-type Na+ efflux pump permease subunit
MKLAAVAQVGVRIGGSIVLLLGLVIWSGRADELKDLHKLIGIIVVVALWTLAFLAARARVPLVLVVLATVWGLIQPVLGLTQENLLTGDWHWVIQVVHLLFGLGVIGWGERLGRAIKSAAPAASRLAVP